MSGWLRRMSETPGSVWAMGVLSFCEALFLPVPLEVALVPFLLANRRRLWLTTTVVTVACLAGGLTGYAVGYFLFNSAGEWLLGLLDFESQFEAFQRSFGAHGFWAILAVGVSPVPYQVAMLAAGVTGYPVWKFLLASAIARSARYFGLSLLVLWFGERAIDLWRRHRLVASLAAAGIVGIAWFVFGVWLGGEH